MEKKDFTATIELEKSTQDVFKTITEDVAKWWGGNDLEGSSTKLNEEFVIQHSGAHYSKQKLVEVIPDRKVVWLVTSSHLNWLEKDKGEWTNTKIVFEILHNQTGITAMLLYKTVVGLKFNEKQLISLEIRGSQWQVI